MTNSSRAAALLNGLGIVSGALHGELRLLAEGLSAFTDAPAGNRMSTPLSRMQRAAAFCGLWGVANYIGALAELALVIESCTPESASREEVLDKVKALASGINALGVHVRELHEGRTPSFSSLNESFGRVLRKARPKLLELTPAELAPSFFMAIPPTLEVEAYWKSHPAASRATLLEALKDFCATGEVGAEQLSAVADANPYRTLSGLFEPAAAQGAGIVGDVNWVSDLKSEFARLLEVLKRNPMVPPSPDAFLVSRLLHAIAEDESTDSAKAAIRARYALVKPKTLVNGSVHSMHDIARKFAAGMTRLHDAYQQSALSNTPYAVRRLVKSFAADASRLDSEAFVAHTANLASLTDSWDTKEPSREEWVAGAAMVLLLQESSANWAMSESQSDLTEVAAQMAGQTFVPACSSMLAASRIAAIQKTVAHLQQAADESRLEIEQVIRSIDDAASAEQQAERVLKQTSKGSLKYLSQVAGFLRCLGLERGHEFASRVAHQATLPQSWGTTQTRQATVDDLLRLSLLLGRLRPNSLIDMQPDEMVEAGGPIADDDVGALAELESAADSSGGEEAESECAEDLVPAEECMPVIGSSAGGDEVAPKKLEPPIEITAESDELTAEPDEVIEPVGETMQPGGTEGRSCTDAAAETAAPGLFDDLAEEGELEHQEFDVLGGFDILGDVEHEGAENEEKSTGHADSDVDREAMLAGFLAAAVDEDDCFKVSDVDLLNTMFEEADQCMAEVESGLKPWLSDQGAKARLGTVESIRRHVHTLKGILRTCGLMRFGAVLHSMEDHLETIADDGRSLAGAAQAHSDAMAAVRESLEGARRVFEEHQLQLSVASDFAAADKLADAVDAVDAADAPNPATLTGPLESMESPEFADSVSLEESAEATDSSSSEGSVVERVHVGGGAEIPMAGVAPVDVALQSARAPTQSSSVAQVAGLPSKQVAGLPSKSVDAPGKTVRVPVRLASRVGVGSGQVLMASRRSLDALGRSSKSLRELTSNLARMSPIIRELDILAASSMPSASAGSGLGGANGFDPLELDRYTALQELVRKLKEVHEDLEGSAKSVGDDLRSTQGAEEERAQLVDDLQRDSSELMLVSVSSQRARLERVVSQACEDAGKKVRLVIEPSCKVPAAAVDALMPVFEHLLRNAVAHGVEQPAERRAAGKSEMGTILISHSGGAGTESGAVKLVLSDDGRGIDHQAVLEVAKRRGLASSNAEYSDEAIREFLFTQGFSTASSVSQLSGRGVGLDVVRRAVVAIGGMVAVSTRKGSGTAFQLTLPTDVSTMPVVSVTARPGGQPYLLPLSLISRIVPVVSHLGVSIDDEAGTVTVADSTYKLLRLSGLVPETAASTPSSTGRGRGHLVIMSEAGAECAVYVDGIGRQSRMTVRPLGPFVRDIPGMVAGAELPNGDVGLVVNPMRLRPLSDEDAKRQSDSSSSRSIHVMIADDSSTVRMVTSRFLRRLGYEVSAAKDGVEALNLLSKIESPQAFVFDLEMPGMDGFELIAAIRRMPAFAGTPIIVVSSRTALKHRERAREVGATAYLAKPYEDDQLQELLEHLVGAPLTT